MPSLSVGDLASSFYTRRSNADLKQAMTRLTQELSSGQKSNVATAVAGDLSPLVAIENTIANLAGFRTSVQEASMFANIQQTALGIVQSQTEQMSGSLFLASSNPSDTAMIATSNEARSRLDSIMSALNTRVGDRNVFSGMATQSPALGSADDMLSSIEAAITTAGAITPADVQTVINDWFDTPSGGFETVTYLGSMSPVSPFQLSEHERATATITAENQSIRDVLKGFAMASLVERGLFVGNVPFQARLLEMSGEQVLSSNPALVSTRAIVGSLEGKIEETKTSQKNEDLALQIARNEITAADPFETAAQLQSAQTQLELLYTMTARLSRLNLSDYLR